MYIGRNSISSLKAFLDGWYLRSPDTISDIEVMGEFQDWVCKKYKIDTHSWDHILLFYSFDEYNALQEFFKQFELFLSERKK